MKKNKFSIGYLLNLIFNRYNIPTLIINSIFCSVALDICFENTNFKDAAIIPMVISDAINNLINWIIMIVLISIANSLTFNFLKQTKFSKLGYITMFIWPFISVMGALPCLIITILTILLLKNRQPYIEIEQIDNFWGAHTKHPVQKAILQLSLKDLLKPMNVIMLFITTGLIFPATKEYMTFFLQYYMKQNSHVTHGQAIVFEVLFVFSLGCMIDFFIYPLYYKAIGSSSPINKDNLIDEGIHSLLNIPLVSAQDKLTYIGKSRSGGDLYAKTPGGGITVVGEGFGRGFIVAILGLISIFLKIILWWLSFIIAPLQLIIINNKKV